jgi:hypothetical protein
MAEPEIQTKRKPGRPRKVETLTKALLPSEQPERMKLGEIGYSGLSMFNGISQDELYRELTWPCSIKTYKQMSYHAAVGSCLNLYDSIISKVNWRVVPPQNATQEEIDQTKFIEECLLDMDTPMRTVIRDALSSNIYGFAVQEKVYRRRLKQNGSLFNDGKIGIKKIALRNQESIEKFIYSEDGSEILGVKQNLSAVQQGRYTGQKLEVVIPRQKYIHVATGRNREDPFGKSPLRDVYLSYRFLVVAEELESTGVSKDLAGLPLLKLPAQYMSTDASPEQKILFENFKNIARNMQVNAQSSLVLPSDVNPETRAPLFDFELISSQGSGKSFDISSIKSYYQNQVYTTLGADLLLMGSSGNSGSFSLGQIKSSLTGATIESMLDNIVDAFQRDLIRHIYELNGFDASRMCKLDYNDLNSTDLESLSKAYQRYASTGLLELDRDTLNAVRKSIGIDQLPADKPVDYEALTTNSSRSGDGMALGTTGNGTATSVTGTDTSSNNLENVG